MSGVTVPDLAGVLRSLPAARPGWPRAADVVVAGSGAAGITAALAAAARGCRVLLVTKQELGAGSTPLAQGGLAAAIGPGDSPARHGRDTVTAGAGLSDPDAVAALVAGAPGVITRLAALGARLARTGLGLEGGHSHRRIVHAGGDATGAEVHRVLAAALLASPVEVLTRTVALDLLLDESGRAAGLLAGTAAAGAGSPGGQPLTAGIIRAPAVVLATGGFGQAFAVTTNPPGVTGDGLALAARAGAVLRDPEFVQFHPTVLWQPGAAGQRPLITEALRGAGAVLADQAGRPVMTRRHPLGDLAPRDVVAAAMHERIAAGDGPGHLWLDATGLGRAVLEQQFPTVTALCRARGIDPVTEPIPVAPGAHYACGGIRTGLAGQASVPGLYAVGEAAATGVHGANRLASNSLPEALLAGQRTGELLGAALGGTRPRNAPDGHGLAPRRLPGQSRDGGGVCPASRAGLAAAMSRHAGVVRDAGGLEQLLAGLAAAPPLPAGGELTLAAAEAVSVHTVSVIVAAAALARAESRGCHRRRDAPGEPPGPAIPTLWRWHPGTATASPHSAGPDGGVPDGGVRAGARPQPAAAAAGAGR